MISQDSRSPNNTSSEKVKSILNLLQQGEAIKYESHKNIMLFLGNTGSGKSTFTQFIAGDNTNLIAKEVGEETGEFIIVDSNNKISGNSTITSQTVFPEMLIDSNTNTILYDCPGFSDTRSLAHDITVTYFIKRIIDSAKSVKLVFVVSYPSVRQGVDRQDFMLLVKHAISMIKNIDKFRDSIALIVTKVDNEMVRKRREYVLVPDEKIINKIADFLRLVQHELENKSKIENSLYDDEFYKNAIKFIDILLAKEQGVYSKIGIFRRPDMPGAISDIPLLQEGKSKLHEIIFNNIYFITHSEPDFGYTISAESKNYIHDLTEEINRSINLNVAHIGNKIKNHYLKIENQFYDVQYLYNQFYLGDSLVIEMKNSNKFVKPRDIINPLIAATSSLNIISGKQLYQISTYDKYLNFIETINEKTISHPFSWVQGLTDTVNYIDSSKKWYLFLSNLFNQMSDYEIHSNIEAYKVDQLKYQMTYCMLKIKDNKKVTGKDINLKEFLSQFEYKYNLNYDELAEIILNEHKLNNLKNVIDNSLDYKILLSNPVSNKLIVRGKYIKLSEVAEKISEENIEFIEIFALYKVFIDASIDKTGHKAKISIIAPTWEIVRNQKIILDGIPGATPKNKISTPISFGTNGEPGESGKPGGPAGHFIGIGDTFINGEFLSITANGGEGGAGQDGGDGADGAKGVDPPIPDVNEENVWRQENFPYTYIYNNYNWEHTFLIFGRINIRSVKYRVYGKNGTHGGNGGAGGIGGEGGHNGIVKLIEANKNSNIFISTLSGKSGRSGIGGQGGQKGINGRQIVVAYYRKYDNDENFPSTNHHKIHNYYSYPVVLYSGGTGVTGSSIINRIQPENVPFPEILPTVNSYKKYILENVVTNPKELFLTKFYNQLNTNERIFAVFNTMGFIDEFFDLENQFNRMKHTTSILHFYKSLLDRLIHYSVNPKISEQSNEYKKVLAYLYTAVLSKICNMEHSVSSDLKLDLNQFLENTKKNIIKMKDMDILSVEIDYYDNQEKEIKTKIRETTKFIDTKISTVVVNIIQNLEEKMEILLSQLLIRDEHSDEQNAPILEYEVKEDEDDIMRKTEEQRKAKQQEQELKHLIILRSVVKSVEISKDFLSILSPLALALISAQNFASNKSLLLDGFNKEKVAEITAMLSSVQDSMKTITSRFEKNLDLLVKQFEDVEQQLSSFLKVLSTGVLKQLYEKVSAILETTKGDISDKNDVYKMRDDVLKLIVRQQSELETSSLLDDSVKKQLKLLKFIENTLTTDNISVSLYEKIRNNPNKINKLAQSIRETTETINKIKVSNDKLFKLFSIPDIEKNIESLVKNFQSQFSIVILTGNWNIQKVLEDVKHQLKYLNIDSYGDESITQCMDRMERSISFITNVFDNIENINEQAKLSAHISDISCSRSAEIEVQNETLIKIINTLDKVIKTNFVARQYSTAKQAFQQYVFPFAKSYTDILTLPDYAILLMKNYTVTDFADQVVRKLEDLQNNKVESLEKLSQYDAYIHNAVEFNDDYVQMSPFLVWNHVSIKQSISKLLEGKGITLKADVFKGIDRNAIKFNQIGIRFKLNDDSLQEVFDQLLDNFGITMVHHGDSHFRCGRNTYIMISDEKSIYYSFKQKENGEPIDTNIVYDNIKRNHLILSPYATWTLKMNNITDSFQVFNKFKNMEIDMELTGRGQYIDTEIDVCTEKLEEYKIDESMTMLENYLYDSEKIRNSLLEEMSPNTSGGPRSRRNVISNEPSSEEPDATSSGASSTTKFSIMSNIMYPLTTGFAALKYLNPVNTINLWFTKDDNKILDESFVTNYSLPYNKIVNEQPCHNMNKLQIPNSKIENNIHFDVPELQSNLLLLNLLAKIKNKNKYSSSSFEFTNIDHVEYAHRLAYRAHIPKE